MDLLLERWEKTVAEPGVQIVRLHAQENEKEMVEAFYTYLLGVDTTNADIPIIFESIYHNDAQYSNALLDELSELITLWNNANKDAINIETTSIEWKPDYDVYKSGNEAYRFVENMNGLAKHLRLKKGVYLVTILKVSFVQQEQFCRWIESALKVDFDQQFKILIDDSVGHPFYEKLSQNNREHIVTLRPNLDMDNAMQQVAAMGNPDDPAVQYRQAFMKLMQAIEKRKENEAEKAAALCIEIAERNLIKNPLWVGQIIAVYAALSNDQVGYRNFKKAIAHASKAVKAANDSEETIHDEFVCRKFQGQSIMMRAALYAANKEWQEAIDDFNIAASHYEYTNDVILAIEANRMTGYCYDKIGDNDSANRVLVKSVQHAMQLPAHIVKFTTFAGAIELLLQINNSKYISHQEIEEAAVSVYGDDWLREIKHWKSPHYEQVNDASKVMTV